MYGGEGRRVETGPGGDESRVDMGVGDYGGTTQTEAAFPASHGDLTPTPQHQIPPVMLIMMDDNADHDDNNVDIQIQPV